MIAPRESWELEVRQTDPRDGQGWLAELHADHGPGLQRMLRGMLGHEDDAQDVYQDCLCHLAHRYASGPFRNVKAYAYRAATNLATEAVRRRQRRAAHWRRVVAEENARTESFDVHPLDSAGHDHPETLGLLPGAVWNLPAHLRDVIVLRDLAQMPYRQLAGILGIQPTTARVYRRQAVIRLGKTLARQGSGPQYPPSPSGDPSTASDRDGRAGPNLACPPGGVRPGRPGSARD